MKLIVLAAGQGTRLRPLTDTIPKCLVPLQGKPLLQYQLDCARQVGIADIHVVAGYRADSIADDEITKHVNENYATTNMVESLFVAENELYGDVIVSYGDIVYQPDVLQKLMDAPVDVGVVVDRAWEAYWSARMENPLEDAESLRMRPDGTIIELGQKTASLENIQGQYIGLMKFSAQAISQIRSFFHSLDRDTVYQESEFQQMYMTTFLQLIADRLIPVHAVLIDNGWMEVDCESDLAFTHFLEKRQP